MDILTAPDHWLARLVLLRGLGLIYLLAFVAVVDQFRPLLGERGLLPVPRFVAAVPFRRSPSLFHLRYSDRLATVLGWLGILLAAAVVLGLPERGPIWLSMLVWAVLWLLYLSFVNVGQIFYAFGWESVLLEAGFLAIFLGPAGMEVPLLVLILMRWLLFRVEFGAGLIKMRGDRCWRELTCTEFHHETQPLPNPLSWYFHHLPRWAHRAEVAANHVTQLVVPFALFLPQPIASGAGAIIIVTQGWLLLSGNFAWLNLITMVLAVSALDDRVLEAVLPIVPPDLVSPPPWFSVVVILVAVAFVVMSYWPVRNMVSSRQRMNASFNPLHLGNTYGAFGSVTKRRFEVIVEGTLAERPDDDADWREYGFRAEPGDTHRRPPQVAPYHLRLDWLMWFAAMASPERHPWFRPFVARLLEADPATLRLLRHDPFHGERPRFVRARLVHQRFTTPVERRESGAWWARRDVRLYLPPVSREDDGRSRRR